MCINNNLTLSDVLCMFCLSSQIADDVCVQSISRRSQLNEICEQVLKINHKKVTFATSYDPGYM